MPATSERKPAPSAATEAELRVARDELVVVQAELVHCQRAMRASEAALNEQVCWCFSGSDLRCCEWLLREPQYSSQCEAAAGLSTSSGTALA